MEKISNQERLKPWMGIVLFAVVMALFLTAGAYMQTNWGKLGLLLTEVMFLLLAVGFCLIRKVNIKEMFPIRDTIWSIMKVLEAKKRAVLSNIQLIPIGKDSLLKNKI